MIGEQAAVKAEEMDTTIRIAVYHEAGHAVVAAALGIGLRAEGIMVGADARGLACICKEPDGTDASRERIILAMYSGAFAQKAFCQKHGYSFPEELGVILGGDATEARGIETKFSWEYLGARSIPQVDAILQQESNQLVAAHWPAIEAVAEMLATRQWESLKPLKSGGEWSKASLAKYVSGEELVQILKRFNIDAVCVLEC